MIEFHVRVWNTEGGFVSDAMMGPHGLVIEIDHLPLNWRMEIIRVARELPEPVESNVVTMAEYREGQ